MRRKTKREVRINQRDRQLFKYLYENKIASRRQIRRDFFGKRHPSIASRRLSKLIEEGFLKEISLTKNTHAFKAYSITPKTFDHYLSDQFEGVAVKQFEGQSLFHDIDLVDIRNSLARREIIANYLTENIIQSGGDCLDRFGIDYLIKHSPDAVVKVKIEKKYYDFCLEYEATLKSKTRCRDFLKKYYFDRDVAAVFFIYKEEKIYKTILSLEKKLFSNMSPKFYYCSLEKIQLNEEKLKFTNFKNTVLEISKVPTGDAN